MVGLAEAARKGHTRDLNMISTQGHATGLHEEYHPAVIRGQLGWLKERLDELNSRMKGVSREAKVGAKGWGDPPSPSELRNNLTSLKERLDELNSRMRAPSKGHDGTDLDTKMTPVLGH